MFVTFRLPNIVNSPITQTIKNSITEKSNPFEFTLQLYLFFTCSYIEPTIHGNPRPKNTFTELDPVTLPTAASAVSLCLAACIEANVSGKDVPKATKVIAVTYGLSPVTHPNSDANSATIAVIIPMNTSETMKASHPPHFFGGGINAKSN